jgi:peptide chain release factor 2
LNWIAFTTNWCSSGTLFDLDAKERELAKIQVVMERADFWQDQEKAKKTIDQMKALKAATDPFKELEAAIEDEKIMLELAEEEHNDAAAAEVRAAVAGLSKRVERLQARTLFSGPHDSENAYLSIHAGAGGTEACDWVAMLLRMYSRWAEDKKFDVKMVDSLPGDEAGFRSVTLHVVGLTAYGYLRAEMGVHRLVRISPFDSGARRHTSFASVDAVPEYDEDVEFEINDKDLRIDTFRSGGAGGQHVNVTDSAVRITHLPTGVVASCQNERSQHQNKRTAMNILRAKLIRLKEKEREKELAKLIGEKGEIAWGNQIRSYVLQPYTMVKDHRTALEVGDVNGVLDGDIDAFIEAYLKKRK